MSHLVDGVDGLQDAGHPLEALFLRTVGPLLGHHAYPLVPQHADGEHRDSAPVVDKYEITLNSD